MAKKWEKSDQPKSRKAHIKNDVCFFTFNRYNKTILINSIK